jgi:CheY-like chemotaxis protein
MNKKVLIVDDQPEIRHLLSLTLGEDYEVIVAKDGTTALEAVRMHQPQAVLLDIMMPGQIDGLQVLASIKNTPSTRHIPVAMVTARGLAADYRLANEFGADAYFIKPFSPLKLVNWLQEKLK